jgi:hypothetical protein
MRAKAKEAVDQLLDDAEGRALAGTQVAFASAALTLAQRGHQGVAGLVISTPGKAMVNALGFSSTQRVHTASSTNSPCRRKT